MTQLIILFSLISSISLGNLKADLSRIDELRKTVSLRPVELRNTLVEIQEKTGMDFYLKGNPWIEGKIEIK